MSYQQNRDDLLAATNEYFDKFKDTYNKLLKTYGNEILPLFISPTYRTTNQLDVQNTISTTTQITLLGNYKKTRDFTNLYGRLETKLLEKVSASDHNIVLDFDMDLGSTKYERSRAIIDPYIKNTVTEFLNSIKDEQMIKELETNRNKFIEFIDGFNFIMETNGKDARIDKETTTVVSLTDFNVQKLYEQKLVTYPRVDTTYLPENMYPKIKGILSDMKPYDQFTTVLLDKPIKKSKKVFDDKKITDHHAIIPTGILPPSGMYLPEKQVYDLISKRFIAAFYPDCVVSNTVVLGDVNGNEFSATGKVILEEGWRVLFPKKETDAKDAEEQLMPLFVKGEKGEHIPDLQEKQTLPPKMHTEGTLLRAMETAGKQVDDLELRELMKDNGIGRPSTRANIIETLFKRNYIVRQRKNLVPTITGIQLIKTINNELLKSVELTGLWEKKIRQIEKGEYDVNLFLAEMKEMVSHLMHEVKSETGRLITIESEPKKEVVDVKQIEAKDNSKNNSSLSTKPKLENSSLTCPKCKQGTIVKGKTAMGCSAYKHGCQFKVSFDNFGKKLTEKQINVLLLKGKTPIIKGFTIDTEKQNGYLVLNNVFEPSFVKEEIIIPVYKENQTCPQCKQGKLIKGKTLLGCNRYKEGCDFRAAFEIR
jgi:DNA topoisomerase-3